MMKWIKPMICKIKHTFRARIMQLSRIGWVKRDTKYRESKVERKMKASTKYRSGKKKRK